MMNRMFLFFFLLLGGCVYPYAEEAHEIARLVVAEFEKDGLCDERKECDFIKVTGKPGDAIIYIYDAGKLSNEHILMVFRVCQSVYTKHEKGIQIKVRVYRESHEQVWEWFSGAEPYIELSITAVNKDK